MTDWRLAYTVCTPEVRARSPLAYDATFDDACAALAGLGYDGVELQVRDPAELDRPLLTRVLGQLGLRVAAVGTGPVRADDRLSLADPDPSVQRGAVRRLGSITELAADLGAPVTVGSVRGDVSAAAGARTRLLRALTQVCERAAAVDVRVVLEPQNRHVGNFLHTVGEALQLAADIGTGNVGVLADTFHMSLEEPAVEAGLVEAGELLWHVQFGDSNRLHPGGGHLRFNTLLHVLRALGYNGWISMEHQQVPDSATAAGRSLALVRLLSSVG